MSRPSTTDACRSILDEEMELLGELPYGHWRALLGAPRQKTVAGPGGRVYRVVVTPTHFAPESTDVQVRVTVRATGWMAAAAVEGSFVVRADAAGTALSMDTPTLDG